MVSSIITGSLIISLLHAVIPNHWLPIIAIGRKEGWSVRQVLRITLISALAHAASTILIGLMLASLGASITPATHDAVHVVGSVLLIVLGLVYIYRHHKHKHFDVAGKIKRKASQRAIIIALVVAMFFSPCMEVEAYFLLAGTEAWWLVWLIVGMYTIITTLGMLLLVGYAYRGLLKLNWHSLEHNSGIITGVTLIITGIVTFFIQ